MADFYPDYPSWLETWWCEQTQRFLPEDLNSALDRLVPVVQTLSDLFVTEPSKPFAAYDTDPRTLLAYGLFYFPQSFVRTQWPVWEIIQYRGWKPPEQRPLRILDLGAGLGGASLGLITAVAELYPSVRESGIHLTAVDHGADNLRWLQRLVHDHTQHWPYLTLETRHEDLFQYGRASRSLDVWDLILSSFALTEVFRGQPVQPMWTWLQGVWRHLTAEGLLLSLEPASQDSCERLEDIRDLAVASEYPEPFHLWGPCLHRQRCPLRALGQSWCHEVRDWQAPPSLQWLNRRLYHEIQVLRFGFLALAKQPSQQPLPASQDVLRLVAPLIRKKGHWITSGCSATGLKKDIEIFQRDLRSDHSDQLTQITRGNLVWASDLQERSSHHVSSSQSAHRRQYRLPPGQSLHQLFPSPCSLSLPNNTSDRQTKSPN